MKNCKNVSTHLAQNEKLSKDNSSAMVGETNYLRLTGYLLHLTATRPNIMFTVSLLYRFMNCPTEAYLIIEKKKRVLRYSKRTIDFGVTFCLRG
ncbi:hypothetical protein ERO13_D12G085001v2 [Gossypium hirsutum]|nr:hypothetical protein ERO13_D12G085001v2 [Gossypium hirsutum]